MDNTAQNHFQGYSSSSNYSSPPTFDPNSPPNGNSARNTPLRGLSILDSYSQAGEIPDPPVPSNFNLPSAPPTYSTSQASHFVPQPFASPPVNLDAYPSFNVSLGTHTSDYPSAMPLGLSATLGGIDSFIASTTPNQPFFSSAPPTGTATSFLPPTSATFAVPRTAFFTDSNLGNTTARPSTYSSTPSQWDFLVQQATEYPARCATPSYNSQSSLAGDDIDIIDRLNASNNLVNQTDWSNQWSQQPITYPNAYDPTLEDAYTSAQNPLLATPNLGPQDSYSNLLPGNFNANDLPLFPSLGEATMQAYPKPPISQTRDNTLTQTAAMSQLTGGGMDANPEGQVFHASPTNSPKLEARDLNQNESNTSAIRSTSPLTKLDIPNFRPPISEDFPMGKTSVSGGATAVPSTAHPQRTGTSELDKLLKDWKNPAPDPSDPALAAFNMLDRPRHPAVSSLASDRRRPPQRQRSRSDADLFMPPNHFQGAPGYFLHTPLANGIDPRMIGSDPRFLPPSSASLPSYSPATSDIDIEEDGMRESQVGPRRHSNANSAGRPNHNQMWPYDDRTGRLPYREMEGNEIRRAHSALGHSRNAQSEDFHGLLSDPQPYYNEHGQSQPVPREYFYPSDPNDPAYTTQAMVPHLYNTNVPVIQHMSRIHPYGGPPTPTRSLSNGSGDGTDIMSDPLHWVSQTTLATKNAAAARRKPGTEAKFVCDYCGETFTRQYNLKGHIRAHNGQKPYVCDHAGCDKAFARAHDLKRHMTLHTSVAKYQCLACGRCFKRLDALQRHNKSEAGQLCVAKLVEQGVYAPPSPKRQVAL